jgi:hypothetical protein
MHDSNTAKGGAVEPKDEAREWLDQRCGRVVHVETHLDGATTSPLVREGPLTKRRTLNPEVGNASEENVSVRDLYEVGTASYNLADLPDDIEVHIRTAPLEQLEMTFDDGTSALVRVMITAIGEVGQE